MDIMDNIINQMKSYRVWIQIYMQEEKKNIEEKERRRKSRKYLKEEGQYSVKKN